MGKKKVVKTTKELSATITEASSMGEEGQQQEQTPRKRGRPRKVIQKSEEEMKDDAIQTETKKVKTTEEQQEEEKSVKIKLQVGTSRSRAKRKSKPRKSS